MLWISLIVVALVLVVGSYFACSEYFRPAETETAEVAEVQTAVARRYVSKFLETKI